MTTKFSEPMVATKQLKYNTRMLTAGEPFLARPKDVRVLEALDRAKRGRAPNDFEPPSPELRAKIEARFAPALAPSPTPPATSPLDHDGDGKAGGSARPAGDDSALGEARKAYFEAMGKRPFSGWDVAELQRRMAAGGSEAATDPDTAE
jgi:hypothetical protein